MKLFTRIIFILFMFLPAIALADPNGNGTVNPIPEPTTMLLFGSGLIGLAGFRRRFKKS